MDRSWMYDMNFPGRRGLKQQFVDGVEEFINIVKEKPIVISEGGIRCPCKKCKCGRIRSIEEIKSHLYHHGFKPHYWIWTSHGENYPSMKIATVVKGNDDAGPSNKNLVPDVQNNHEFEAMNDMISNALGVNESFNEPQYDDTDQLPNEEAQRFYCLLKETNTPLFKGSTESKLSMCVRLLGLKSQFQVPDLALDLMTKLMLDATPIKDGLPQSYYDAKQLVSKLGLSVKRIDCCVNGCMLYYDNEFGIKDGELVECKHCQEPRYHAKNNSRSSREKLVPRKVMFYLPIVPRLQRMFASMQTAGKMTWHYENKSSSDELRHPSDGEAWKHFDRVHPTFALDARNVRLGLCFDGFTPYIQASATPYSCCPVIVTPYNLPPDMCMSKSYMFLTAVIPGPSNPTAGIDIFLQPLIDDLKRLWNGVLTYDIARKENFMMRAALMWTISDFPVYGMLSGWGSHGKMTCPVCMEDTKAFTLNYSGKTSWFDSHRRYLPHDHPFRRNETAFLKGCVETLGPPIKLTSEQVWDKVKDVPKVKVIKGIVQKPQGYGQEHHWIKRSIFWDLQYWKDNLLRHNLDVMHIEKQIFDNIFNTVMNVKGKTKDNDKARKDLAVHCRRPELVLVEQNNGKYLKPRANFTLKPEDVKSVYQWIKELKMPDDYSSNIPRCVDVEKERMHGMKSHDCHVFMECLLPIAFSCLPTHVFNPLVEVSQYFKNLCSVMLREDDLIKMENDIPVILCKLEKVFPPGFFDSMVHLPVHLAYEARLGGPVQYRWLYPFERFLRDSKRQVKNKARVEGLICSSYLHHETTHFLSHYFKDTTLSQKNVRNEIEIEIGRHHPFCLSIFCLPGRHDGREMSTYWPNEQILNAAHVHLLINCDEVAPYLETFLTSGQSSAQIHSNFPAWFRQQVYLQEPTPFNRHLRNLSDGPQYSFREWHTYFVNGFKFHTQSLTEGKETINSGVCIKGVTKGGENDFYGVIEHIYEISYPYLDYKKEVVLFYCKWFDPSSRGTKFNSMTNTVDICLNRRYEMFDPFVMAHNVRQVYYVPYPSNVIAKRGWCVAIKTKPRCRRETDETYQEAVAYQIDSSNANNVIEVEPFSRLCDDLPNTGEEVNEEEGEVLFDLEVELIHSSDDDLEDQWDT